MTDRAFGILIELKDRFSQGLRAIRAPIENAKRELRQLEQAGRELKWAEKYQAKLERMQPALASARENQARLAAAMAATENPSAALTREYEKAQRKLAALETQEREYTAHLEQSRERLREAGIDTEDLAEARRLLGERTDQARARTLGFHNILRSIDVREDAQRYSGLATKLLIVKTAMAALTAAAAGLAPVLASAAATAGMAFATAMSTAKVAAMSKELQKFSETTQISTQALQEWRLAGRFEGVKAEFGELGDMGKVFTSLQDKMQGLGSKDGEDFAKSLSKIGLSAKEIKALKPEEALLRIGDALDKSKLTQQQKITFLKDISDDAANLLPLLEKSGKSFAEIRNYANAVGAIQSPEQLETMKKTNRELSFWKLGLEGVMTRLSGVGANVVNTLGPNVRKLFVDAKEPIEAWSRRVSEALGQFKADVDDMGWAVAFKRQIQSAYPTLYGFVSGAGAFGRGYGESFVTPMLDSLKKGWARIGDAMSGGDGIESKGRAWGEAMRPMTAIIDEVTKAIAFLIENFKFLKVATEFTPLGMFLDTLPYIRQALDWVGDGIKKLGQAFGLIDPNSTASGFTVLLGTLAALAAAAFANKLALGAMGAVFNVLKFSLSPLVGVLSLLRGGLGLLFAPLLRLVGGAGLLSRAFMVIRIGLSILFMALRANPIGIAVTAIAMAAGFIIRNWSRIGPWFANMWGRVKASFTAARAALSNMSWGQIAVKIVTSLAMLPAKLFQIAITAVGRMAIGLLSRLGLISGSTAQIMQNMVSGFASLPGKLMEMGKLAIAGLANGIKAAGAQALNAAKQIASDVGNAVKSFFDIRSPSRLMMGYGGNISAGLAQGINEDGRQAIANAKALSDGVSKQLKPLQTSTVVSFADARQRLRPDTQKPQPQQTQRPTPPPRDTLVTSLTKHRQELALSGETRQQVGGEIRVKIDAPAGMNTSAKVSKPAGSKVGLTANVGKVSW